jgi:hypothetical protein
MTGMAGTPYRSGLLQHEQGIGRPAINACDHWPSRLPGPGSSTNDRVHWRSGTPICLPAAGRWPGKSGLRLCSAFGHRLDGARSREAARCHGALMLCVTSF